MIQSDGVNSRWKKYADTEPAETVEVTEEPSLEVPVVESPSQSQEKPPVSNRWSKYATGPTTPAETIPSRPATPAMAAQAATTARQQAAEPPKQEAFEDVPKEIASFKFNPEVENMIIGDDIAANTGLYAMNRGNVKGYYKTNDVVKGVVADLETKANQLKIDYEAKVAQLNETTKAEQEKLNAEFSQKDAEIEKGYAEAVKAAKTPEEKALADKNYELDKNALNAEFKAKADSVGQKLKGEYDKAYADLTKSMEDLSSYTKDWETPEGFGKWYEDYEKENRAIGDSERKSIQEVIKAMPNDYEGKKAALQRFTNSYLDAYDGQPEYDQVKDELYDIIRSETLFDAQGNPTPYALKNQAEIEKRSMADEYNRLNAEFKEITKGVPTGYGSDMYYLALNKIPGAREMQTRLSYLSQAINNFERISKLPESEMKGKRAGSFMEGMGGVKNLIPNTLSAGLLEQMESVGMLRLAQKVKHGQALTEDEQLYLDSVSLLETTVQLMRPDFKNWYLAGRATGESLPWITNMIATGGAYSWGKLGMMKVLKSAGYREGRKWSAKTIGKTILTEAAGSASRIPFQPSFYQNIAENIAKPESVAGEMGLEGKMKATGKTMAGAVVKASYMQFAENFSEISGTYMDAGGKAIVGLVAKKLGLNVANAIPKTKLVSAMGQFGKVWSKFRDVAKISSIPAEYGEEIFANVLHLVDGTTKPSDIVDLRENWITFLSVASMVGPMQVVSGTAKGTAAVITKQDLAKGMQEFFSGQQIKEIDRIISIQDVGKKTDALLDFIQRNRVDGAEPLQSLARYVWDEQLAQGAAAASEAQDAPATTDAKAPLYMVDKKTGSVEEILDLISTAESTADLAGITIENDPEAKLELSTKFNKLQEDERFNEAIKGVTDAAEIERLTDEHVAKLEEIDDKYKADLEKIQERKTQPTPTEVEPKVETVKPETEQKLAETEEKKTEGKPVEEKPVAESEQKKETVKPKEGASEAMMQEVGVTNPDVQETIGEGSFSGRVKFVDVVLRKGKELGEVIIESMRTPKLFRRMGRAGKAMAKLTEAADRNGVTLRLQAVPEKGSGITEEQLINFYRKNGFKFDEGSNQGVRVPWSSDVKVTEEAKKEFERLSANAEGAYPSVWVQNEGQLPEHIQEAKRKSDQKGRTEGVYDPVTGKVYFVAEELKTKSAVAKVWLHEQVGHRGIRLIYPDKKSRDEFYKFVFSNVGVGKMLSVVSTSEAEIFKKSKKTGEDTIRLADEYIAYLTDKVVNKKTLTVEEKSIWKKLVDYIRGAMNKMFGRDNVNRLTDDDIAKIINQSLGAIYPKTKKGGTQNAEETGKVAQEKGAEVGAVEGEAGRLRVRDDERDGLEAEEGEKIRFSFQEKFPLFETLSKKGRLYGYNRKQVVRYLRDNVKDFKDVQTAQKVLNIPDGHPAIRILEQAFNPSPEIYTMPTDVSSRLTTDENGDYVFHHYRSVRREKIDPKMSGKRPDTFTNSQEIGAMGDVGGENFYYTEEGQREAQAGKVLHTIVVPKEKVYFINEDYFDFISEARQRHEKLHGKDGIEFSPNHQVAQITKIAQEHGFDMTVSEWEGSGLRGQSVTEKVPQEKDIPLKERQVQFKVGMLIDDGKRTGKITDIDSKWVSYEVELYPGQMFQYDIPTWKAAKTLRVVSVADTETRALPFELTTEIRSEYKVKYNWLKRALMNSGMGEFEANMLIVESVSARLVKELPEILKAEGHAGNVGVAPSIGGYNGETGYAINPNIRLSFEDVKDDLLISLMSGLNLAGFQQGANAFRNPTKKELAENDKGIHGMLTFVKPFRLDQDGFIEMMTELAGILDENGNAPFAGFTDFGEFIGMAGHFYENYNGGDFYKEYVKNEDRIESILDEYGVEKGSIAFVYKKIFDYDENFSGRSRQNTRTVTQKIRDERGDNSQTERIFRQASDIFASEFESIRDGVGRNKRGRTGRQGLESDEAIRFSVSYFPEKTAESIQNNPIFISNLFGALRGIKFSTGYDFRKWAQDEFYKNLPKLRKVYGKDLTPGVMNDSMLNYMSDVLTAEVKLAIAEHPDAMGWYDEQTKSCLSIMAEIYPELLTDVDAQTAMILAMAITSNGNMVDYNMDLADRQYAYFSENGRFDDQMKMGRQQQAIRATLTMLNHLLDNGVTINEIRGFFTKKYRIGDLSYTETINGKKVRSNIVNKGLVNDMVFGAAVIGRKIGNGFFMNLWGEFSQITIDRWVMRTFGRISGTSIVENVEKRKSSLNNAVNALETVRKNPDALKALRGMVGNIGDMSNKKIILSAVKAFADPSNREIAGGIPALDNLRLKANNYYDWLFREILAPTGSQISFVERVFDRVINNLKSDGINITMADAQAVEWMQEKALSDFAKTMRPLEQIKKNYEKESLPNYENAAKRVAAKHGIDRGRVESARTSSDRIRKLQQTATGILFEGVSQADKDKVKTLIQQAGWKGVKDVEEDNTRFSVSGELAPPSTEIKGGRVYKNSRGEEIRFRSVMPKDNALQQKYRYKPKKDNEIFTGMERQIGEVGFMNLTGPATINSPEDVAFLFRNLESAAVENAFVVMMDKDGKYVVLYVGTGNTVGVVADPVLMATAAKEFGAERIVFVHNHPSGNLSASDADMNMHEKLVSACEGICDVLDSVIIDLDSGMFGTFRSTYRDAMYKGDEKREELPVKMFQFNKQILYSKSAEWVTISGSPDVATYLSRVKRGVGNKTMVIIMNRRSAITRTYLSTKLPSKAELIYMAGKHGESIILSSPVSPSTSDLKKLKVDLQKVNISLLDFIEVGQDPSIVNSYKSYSDYGLMEPSPKYVEEIPRFSVGETIEVDGVMRPTTNSEGRPIHPTEEGVRNFWKWFLDSVTVNKKGHPIVFYHNTDAQFTEFDTGKIGTKTDKGFYGSGFYFTSGVGDTHYGEIEMGVYLKIESPYYKKESHRNYEIDSEKLKSDGHDGAIVYPSYHDFNPDNPMEKIAEVVVYEPEQIKSATDNTGTFSEWTADIRFRATPSVPPAPNQFIDDILNTLVSKGALSPKRRDAILQKFRFIPNIKTLPQDEQDFTFIKMLLDEGRINLSKGLGELSSIITKSLNNIRRDEKEMVTDGQYRAIINRLGNADTVKKMQALLDYVFETVILGRGAKYKAALKMAQKWQGKIADKNKGEKSQFGTARAMANNVEAIDLKQLSFEELEEFSDIASRMFLSPRNPSIPHLAMLDNMFWTRLKPEKEKKEPTPESITDIISAIQSLDPGTITDIPTYISFRRALNRYAKQAAEALASATPDVIEELETNLNDTIENIEKGIEDSIKSMAEELEEFRKAYGVHLVRRLKQADTRNGAKLLESPEEMAVAEELINMQTKDIMDMDINMLAEFETTINNLREGHITPGTFDVMRAGRINRVIRLTLDPAFNIIAQDKTGIWRRRQRAEGRRGVQTLVPKTFRKRDFFNELVRQFKSKQPFRIDNFLGNFSETKKIAKTITDVGRFITMAEIDKQHYDKSAGKAYEIFYKGKSAKEQEKWRKWIFYYMATLRWQSSRFSEKTPNIFHAVYDKLYDVERSKVNDPNGFDNDAKVWGEFMDFLRSKGALNPADENGAETMKEAEAEAVMREDVGVAALIDWVNATVEQYKGMNKVSAGYNGRSLIWGENYVPFMRKYKNDNIESETNIASWLNRAMFNANFVAGSTYEWRGNPMYMEDDIMRVMGLYTEMMRRNYFIYPSFRENVTALKESSRKVHTDLIAKSPYSNGNNISLLGRAFAEALRSRISSYYNSNYMIEQSVALKKAEVAIKKTMLVKIEKFLSEFSVNISRIMLATMNIPVSNINRLWKNYDFWGKEINSWINKGMWSAYSTEINYSLFGGKIEAGRIRRVAKGAEQFADWMIKAPDMGAGRILFVHSTLEKFKELTGEEFDEKKWQESWSYRQKWTDAKDEAMYFADTRVEELFNSKNPLSEGELKSFIGGLLKTDRRDALGRSFSMLMSFGQNDTNQIADSFRRIRNGGPKARLRAIRDINALFMSNFMYAVIRAWAGVMSYKYMYKPAFDAIGNAFVSAFGAPGGGDDDEVMTAIEAKDKEYMDKKTNAFKSGDYYLDILKYKVGPDFLLGGSSNIVEYGGKWLVWIYDRTIGLTDEQREAISAAFYQRYIMLIPHSWGDPEKILIRAIPPLWETAFEDALSFAHSIGDTIMGQTAQSIIEAVFDAEESGQLTKKQVYDLLNLWFTASKYLMFFHPAIPIAERQIRKELRYLNRVAKEEKKEGKTNKAGTEGTQEFKPAGYPKK